MLRQADAVCVVLLTQLVSRLTAACDAVRLGVPPTFCLRVCVFVCLHGREDYQRHLADEVVNNSPAHVLTSSGKILTILF